MIAAQICPLSLLSTVNKKHPTAIHSSAGAAYTSPACSSSSSIMDPGCAFKLLLSCPCALPRSRVLVDFSPQYDRIPQPDPNLEHSIDEIWNQRLQQNPSLYNGQKFRFHFKWIPMLNVIGSNAIQYGGDSLYHVDGSEQESCVCLHLGLTDYRTFVGTNLNPLWEKFLVPSEDDSVRCQHTSSPLGNGAVVETSDGKFLVLQRSQNVGEFPGYFVFPGGHSEPHEIRISSHQVKSNSTESVQLNEKISQEMFEGIIREVVEEIGVPGESLCDPLFIGISRRDLNVRPTAFFYIKCSLGSEEICQLYSSAQDGYESTHLYTVSKDELEKMALRMPGCHRGGFALYVLMVEATKCICLS